MACDKKRKRLFNRIIRKDKAENPYKDYKKRNNSYDICDFISFSPKPIKEIDQSEKRAYLRK